MNIKKLASGAIWLAVCIPALGWAQSAIASYHSTVVNVTAYTDVKSQTNDHPKIGAWSARLQPGAVAVSPDLLAKGLVRGTKIAIEGFKKDFMVRDKTASNLRNTVDIYMGDNVKKARQFGHQRLRIWWHTPGHAKDH